MACWAVGLPDLQKLLHYSLQWQMEQGWGQSDLACRACQPCQVSDDLMGKDCRWVPIWNWRTSCLLSKWFNLHKWDAYYENPPENTKTQRAFKSVHSRNRIFPDLVVYVMKSFNEFISCTEIIMGCFSWSSSLMLLVWTPRKTSAQG